MITHVLSHSQEDSFCNYPHFHYIDLVIFYLEDQTERDHLRMADNTSKQPEDPQI